MVPDHFFRHEHGRLVSVLSRRFGHQSLELCEDAAQIALLRAVENWTRAGVPDEPGAWLYRVAHHHVLDVMRAQKRRLPDSEETAEPAPVYLASEVPDDLLRMMFLCADSDLPYESQIALALKTLCGFSTEEIGLRLFHSTDAIHKRLQRARARLRERDLDVAPDPSRVPSVLTMLYLLFNEGYSSAKPDSVIRRELCEEAIRLTAVIAEHPLGALPETDALLAMMYLHAARFDARLDSVGGLLLLREQDRARWDRSMIEAGVQCLARSARGDRFSRYHAEAAIAAQHCLSPTYEETPWEEITRLYDALDRVAPSPLNHLNRAIAIAEWKGAEEAIAALEGCAPLDYYLWDATWSELYRRIGDTDRARHHLTRAIDAAPTHAERALLERRR
jgi:RNA polymerase sigma factor (sigma-70 family)